jgi:hypothetical protein
MKRVRVVFLKPYKYIMALKCKQVYDEYTTYVNLPLCYECKRYLINHVCFIFSNRHKSIYRCVRCSIRLYGYKFVKHQIYLHYKGVHRKFYKDLYKFVLENLNK